MSDSSNLETRIRRLEDRAEIIELTAKYCRFVTEADKQGVLSLYTRDGVFDRRQTGKDIARGHTEILATYGNSGPGAYLPVIHNHIIEIDGDNAKGHCIVESPVRGGQPGGFVARYEDKYRREGGRWLFAERVVIMMMTFDQKR